MFANFARKNTKAKTIARDAKINISALKKSEISITKRVQNIRIVYRFGSRMAGRCRLNGGGEFGMCHRVYDRNMIRAFLGCTAEKRRD